MIKLSDINDHKDYCKILVRDPKQCTINPITWIRKPKNRFFLCYGISKKYNKEDIDCYLWSMFRNSFLKSSDHNGFLIEHILKNERL